MTVNALASVLPVSATSPISSGPPVAPQELAAQEDNSPAAITMLRPIVNIDSDGLVLLQFQDEKSGDIVFQVPSEQAIRQYREFEDKVEQAQASVASQAQAPQTRPAVDSDEPELPGERRPEPDPAAGSAAPIPTETAAAVKAPGSAVSVKA